MLLLDEPSAGLAPAFVDAIFEKIAEINRAGVTIVMVEQNARRALAMSDRGYVLDLGKNRFEGPGEQLLSDPKVAELYLGGTARIDRAADARPERNGRDPRPRPFRANLLSRATGCRPAGVDRHLVDQVQACRPCTVDVVDAGGRVAVLVHVDRAGRALVVDVLAVLQRLDRLGQLLPGVLGAGRAADVREPSRHVLAVGRAGGDRGQVAEDHGVEVLGVERLTVDVRRVRRRVRPCRTRPRPRPCRACPARCRASPR